MSKLFKPLQPIFGFLFYICIFLIVLCVILSIILLFVNVGADEMLLPPFIKKVENTGIISSSDGDTAELYGGAKYIISFGNGIKIEEDAANVTLGDIKAVLFAGIFVLICTLLTVAPIFKFLSLLLKNINGKNFTDPKNPKYVMYIGLCVFFGNMLIRFMMRFYNYYLAVRFMKDIAEKIYLSLGVDILSGITGLVILFIGFIFAHIFEKRENAS